MNKKWYGTALVALLACLGLLYFLFIYVKPLTEEQLQAQAEQQAINLFLEKRMDAREQGADEDPFGKDGVARVLLIGLDSRIGNSAGHCDAIQLFEIDREHQIVSITAVPRGTYSPLPPGKGVTSTDYYVSNACGLAGLEYGVDQIERILGRKAEHLVIVGFSETLGILRYLNLPTTETLQWLRHRHGYAIGEPQRARNHSNFLKELLVRYTADISSRFDTALQYILYKIVDTDLSFATSQKIVSALSEMQLGEYPERVQLFMRPAYAVQDIAYDPESVGEYVRSVVDPIQNRLSVQDYSGVDTQTVQEALLTIIEEKKDEPAFVVWAFDSHVWLQIENEQIRDQTQFDILVAYLATLENIEEKDRILGDYILETTYRDMNQWKERALSLLRDDLNVGSQIEVSP